MSRLNDLLSVGSMSDKVSHGYMPHYDKYLPQDVWSLLEIGAYKGHSLRLWDHIFPKCDIHTIDLFKDKTNISPKECRQRGYTPHEGDQGDIHFLSRIKKYFEVIIDDGSHNAHHQLISFKHLFVNNMCPGGLYVIEDVHCNKDPFYWQDDIEFFEDTPLSMFNIFKKTGRIFNPYFNEGESKVFESLIENVEICDEKIIFIWKK